MEILQLKGSEIYDVTRQYDVVFYIMFDHAFRNRRGEHQELSSYQWLKQLGVGLEDWKDTRPAVFQWISVVTDDTFALDRSSKGLGHTLRTLRALGADICARWLELSPLQYLFFPHSCSITGQKEDSFSLVEVATALLENGAELFTLSEGGNSVFHIAEYYGLTSELSLAVQRAGHDLDEVRDQLVDLQWVFDNPNCGIAESTAIDNAHIEPSCTTGLASRKGIVGDRLED
ncbi:MAG: hypothetical protein Q9215_007155 [Flavoplaca cf. flavocitrina]